MSDTPRTDAITSYIPLSKLARQLERELTEARKDADRWKERAEYEYAQRIYPDAPGLAVGALDVTMKTWRWERKQECIDAAIDAARKP